MLYSKMQFHVKSEGMMRDFVTWNALYTLINVAFGFLEPVLLFSLAKTMYPVLRPYL